MNRQGKSRKGGGTREQKGRDYRAEREGLERRKGEEREVEMLRGDESEK